MDNDTYCTMQKADRYVAVCSVLINFVELDSNGFFCVYYKL